MAATRFLFVRHGETDWNRQPRFRGHVDVPLNRTGMRQAERVGRRLAGVTLDAVYASPLGRTMRTAGAIARHHDLPVIPDPAIIDMDFGGWHGRTPAAVRRTDPVRYRRWRTAPSAVRIAGAERLADVQRRAADGLRRLARRHRGAAVAVVSHDIVARVLVCAALDLGLDALWRVPQDNAALSLFDHDGRSLVAVSINDTAHLDPPRR
jgi:broad specificity phosphatase PhoE